MSHPMYLRTNLDTPLKSKTIVKAEEARENTEIEKETPSTIEHKQCDKSNSSNSTILIEKKKILWNLFMREHPLTSD